MDIDRLIINVRTFKTLLISAATGKNWDEDNFLSSYEELRKTLISEQEIHTYMPDFVWSCRELREFWQHISAKYRTYRERREYLSKEFEILINYLEYGNSPHTYSANLKKTLIAWLNAGSDLEIAEELDQCRLYAEDGEISHEPDGNYTSVVVRIHAVRSTYDKLANSEGLFRKKVDEALKICISGKKYFGGLLLEALVVDTPLESKIFQKIPATSEIVMASWKKLLQRQQSDPTGAITAARTLVEDVCKYILDELDKTYDSKDDLSELYNKVAKNLSLAPVNHKEDIYRQILGGTNSIVSGLASLRNALGDSHGKGKKTPNPSSRHARFAVNIAATSALFLIETYQQKNMERNTR